MSLREKRDVINREPPATCTWWVSGAGVPEKVTCDDLKKLAEGAFGKVDSACEIDKYFLVFFEDEKVAEKALDRGWCQHGPWNIMKPTPKLFWRAMQPELVAAVHAGETAEAELAATRAGQFEPQEAHRRWLAYASTDGPRVEKSGILFRVRGSATDEEVDAFLIKLAKDLGVWLLPGWRRQQKAPGYFLIFSDWSGVVSRVTKLEKAFMNGHAVDIQLMEPKKKSKASEKDSGGAGDSSRA
eukprot:5448210-Pyramimonas_sp.AAC.2